MKSTHDMEQFNSFEIVNGNCFHSFEIFRMKRKNIKKKLCGSNKERSTDSVVGFC